MEFIVDLTNCDREPIHIPGKIQSHGVLIGIDAGNKKITHVSSNIADFFEIKPGEVLDRDFDHFISLLNVPDTAAALINSVNNHVLSNEKQNAFIVPINDREYHIIIHQSSQTLIVEIEPAQKEPIAGSNEIVSRILTRILGANSLHETLMYSARQVQEIIGYDRVMIYKFAEDGHGEVVAESVRDGFEPFMGLHYPASDIPKQARELYKKNLVRIIADVDATDAAIEVNNQSTRQTPLDLTDSVLRAVSPIHIQYLKNMGVKASFSVSLMSEGELWGLIACHHYATGLIDYKKRSNCKIIGQLLSTSLVFRQSEEEKNQYRVYNEYLLEIIKNVRQEWDIPKSLMDNETNLLSMSGASGAALLYEDKIYLIGETPSEAELRKLADWLGSFNKTQVYQTDHLSLDYDPAKSFKEIASGLLSCALSRELNEYIFWFRKELAQTIRWAGNPEKPVEVNEGGTLQLSPRNSFEVYSQEVQGKSLAWSRNEIAIAMKLREELVHIINERANQIRKLNELLQQAYDELDTFSFTISHDLKTPLASIKNYAELVLDYENGYSSDTRPMLEKIIKAADRMNLLIKEVLSYSRIGRLKPEPAPVNMKEMLELLKSELLMAHKDAQPMIVIENAPVLYGDQTMLYQVFSNIMGNAVKYSSSAKKPLVKVSADVNATETTYRISDNGIGIDMKNGDQIFDLFKRMSNAKSFEGTGVGLAIVKRILEKHFARIWYESEPGNGTIFYLCFKNKPDENGK